MGEPELREIFWGAPVMSVDDVGSLRLPQGGNPYQGMVLYPRRWCDPRPPGSPMRALPGWLMYPRYSHEPCD